MRLVLVHGYLAPAALLWPLGRRLARDGHDFVLFDYPSRQRPFGAHAERLADYLAGLSGPLGLIGHSMGGLLVHRAAELAPEVDVRAQIFLATPHQGSALVRRLGRLPLVRQVATAIEPGAFGVAHAPGRGIAGAIGGARDAMVRPHEARLVYDAPFLTLPYGHNELVLRAETANAIVRFLRTGVF